VSLFFPECKAFAEFDEAKEFSVHDFGPIEFSVLLFAEQPNVDFLEQCETVMTEDEFEGPLVFALSEQLIHLNFEILVLD